MSQNTLSKSIDIQSSEWINSLLSTLEIGVIIVDKSFKVEVWNKFMENHSQVLEEKISGTCLFEHFPELDKDWLKGKCDPVFALSTSVFLIWEQRPYLFKFLPSRPITARADYMYQNITITPILDDCGVVQKVCFTIYDVTDQAISKLQAESLTDELKVISRVDGLTGLYNRRYWQERFDREYKLSQRNQSQHTLLILDIDHFKAVNDTYGHQTGDEVIKHLAGLVAMAIRETDIAGRYGGEEFVVLLPDTNQKNGMMVAERIRQSVMSTAVEHEEQTLNYTCSVGVAQIDKSFQKASEWIEAADQALYEAKKTGRNKVVAHSKK